MSRLCKICGCIINHYYEAEDGICNKCRDEYDGNIPDMLNDNKSCIDEEVLDNC